MAHYKVSKIWLRYQDMACWQKMQCSALMVLKVIGTSRQVFSALNVGLYMYAILQDKNILLLNQAIFFYFQMSYLRQNAECKSSLPCCTNFHLLLNQNVLGNLFSECRKEYQFCFSCTLRSTLLNNILYVTKNWWGNINLLSRDQKQENRSVQSKRKLTFSLNWFQKYLSLRISSSISDVANLRIFYLDKVAEEIKT